MKEGIKKAIEIIEAELKKPQWDNHLPETYGATDFSSNVLEELKKLL